MIEVAGLTRRYGRTIALNKVTFQVEPGQVVGFLGPNGAGKSTAMKILTCSLAPSGGSARVAGCDVMDSPLEVRRKIGFMPENVSLYADLAVKALLRYVADLKSVPRSRLTVHLGDIIEQTGLVSVQDKLVGSLSHGYRQRVGLAQALVGDPEVLFLDEPTSGLDPHQIVGIRQLIRECQGRRTVLFSSHILSEVAAVCQRVLILDRGRLVGDETTQDLEKHGSGLDGSGNGDSRQTVVLTWDGNREAVASALAKVTGVDDLIVTEKGAEVSIAGNPVEIRPKLVESVIGAGGRLQNIHDKGPSLEDLFLRLTGGDRMIPPPALDAKEEP